MEYSKKNRWANYENFKCREYLRNDFSYECAYCKLQEHEVGLVGKSFFQIDHFRPQSDKDNDPDFIPHVYNNLYYSCEKCNQAKSNHWRQDFLNPCNEYIFSGTHPLIMGGYDSQNNYMYTTNDSRATFYIDTLKLNSRYHTKIRKSRQKRKNSLIEINNKIDTILEKFKSKTDIDDIDVLIKQLDKLREIKNNTAYQLSRDEKLEQFEEKLQTLKIPYQFILEDYNMDIKIKVNSYSYYCEILLDNSTTHFDNKIKYLDTYKLNVWSTTLAHKYGILYFCPNINEIYFYPVSDKIAFNTIDDKKQKVQIKLNQEDLLNFDLSLL